MPLPRLQELKQKQDKHKQAMLSLVANARKEERSLNSEEKEKFEKLEKENKSLKSEIQTEEWYEKETRSKETKKIDKDSFESEAPKVELRKVILLQAGKQGKEDCGREKEVHQEFEKRGYQAQSGGIFFPMGERSKKKETRDIESGDVSAFIQKDVIASSFIDNLYKQSVVLPLMSSMSVSSLAPIRLPKASTNITAAQWDSENSASIAESTPTFSEDSAKPRFMGAFTQVSLQALRQTNVESILRSKMALKIAEQLDNDLLNSSDTTNTWSFDGILNAGLTETGPATMKLMTYDKALELVEIMTDMNIPRQNVRFVMSTKLSRILSQLPRFAGKQEAGLLYQNGQFVDQAVFFTPNVGEQTVSTKKGSKIIFGDWERSLLYVNYGALEVSVDSTFDFQKGISAVRAIMPFGFSVRSTAELQTYKNVIHGLTE